MRRWEGASCQGTNPDLWFPPRYTRDAVNEAREACNRCPVAGDCLEYALADPYLDGIWAGTSPRDRESLRMDEDWDAIFAEEATA